MIWNSWAEFFEMGGYALYVWGSILVVFGIIVGELLELALLGERQERSHKLFTA